MPLRQSKHLNMLRIKQNQGYNSADDSTIKAAEIKV